MSKSKSSVRVISHQSHSTKLTRKHKHPSTKRKRSIRVIYVTIGLPKKISGQNNKKQRINTTQHQISTSSILTKTRSLQDKRSTVNFGNTEDYHQQSKINKKKNYKRQCLIISSGGTLLVLLIILAILLALLIKPKTKINKDEIAVLRWNATGTTIAGISGSIGSTNDKLRYPSGVELDYANNMYIVDADNHRIQKYVFGASVGQTVAGNGSAGLSPYQLNSPYRLAIDLNENLYISDTFNHRIQFWSKDNSSGTTIVGNGTAGNSINQVNRPIGIVLNSISRELYVMDFGNNRIMSYMLDNNTSTLIFGGNGAGINNNQFFFPYGLYFDSISNSWLVANVVANNTVRYTLGASKWTIAAGSINGSFGNSETLLSYPFEAILDPMGNMYVADNGNHRIQFFYDGQSVGKTIAGMTGVCLNNATTLCAPHTVRLDSQLNIYVADTNNHRIQKFFRY